MFNETVCLCYEGVEDIAPHQRRVGSVSAYEPYECLIDRTNTWLRDEADVTVVTLQSVLVQRDHTGRLVK